MTHLTEAQLSDLLDGALIGPERLAAERHMNLCDRCRQDLVESRALLVASRQARDGVPAPPELWPLVAASTTHLAAVRRQVLRSMRGVLIAGAIALVAGTAIVTVYVMDWLRPAPGEVRLPRPGSPVPSPPEPPDLPEPPTDQGPGTRDQGPGTRDQGPGTRDLRPGT